MENQQDQRTTKCCSPIKRCQQPSKSGIAHKKEREMRINGDGDPINNHDNTWKPITAT